MTITTKLTEISSVTCLAEQAVAHFVFAHGAGANMHHEFMETFTQLLVQKGISVTRFNFSYMDKRNADNKRYPPDRMPKLLTCYLQVLKTLITDLPLFIGGKSMGSRVGATLLAEEKSLNKQIKGLICVGYPFHPVKRPEKLRLAPLQQVFLPTLIIQGERDNLGSQEEVNQYDLPSFCQVAFLPDGDHSLKPRVKSGYRYEQHLQMASQLIKGFISEQIK